VVVAPEQTMVNADHMNAALDYVIGLSEDSSSPYYNKVDASKLGATGYSLGGAGAMRVAADARIGATFIWDSGGNCSSLQGPLGTIVAGEGLGELDLIDDCPPQSFGMEAEGASHVGILSYPGSGGQGGETPYAQEGYIAWFRWHFMGDPAAEALFVGASCGFCTREGITVRKNGIE
jgi:dienelactone hydrolase